MWRMLLALRVQQVTKAATEQQAAIAVRQRADDKAKKEKEEAAHRAATEKIAAQQAAHSFKREQAVRAEAEGRTEGGRAYVVQ